MEPAAASGRQPQLSRHHLETALGSAGMDLDLGKDGGAGLADGSSSSSDRAGLGEGGAGLVGLGVTSSEEGVSSQLSLLTWMGGGRVS